MKTNEKTMIKIHVGKVERFVTAQEIRNAQGSLRRGYLDTDPVGEIGKNDAALIDAIISHFMRGTEVKWQ